MVKRDVHMTMAIDVDVNVNAWRDPWIFQNFLFSRAGARALGGEVAERWECCRRLLCNS